MPKATTTHASQSPAPALEMVVPADALVALRVQDPGGLLLGPTADVWKPLLLDERWLAPLLTGESDEVRKAELRAALEAALTPCEEVVAFFGGDPHSESAAWMGIALRGARDLAQPLQAVLGGVPTSLPEPEALPVWRSGQATYLAAEGLFLLVQSSDAHEAGARLQAMLRQARSDAPTERTDPFGAQGLASERRSDDWEAVLNFRALFPAGFEVTEPELAPIRADLEATLRSLTWAYLGGSADAQGHWRMRGIFPYQVDTLLGTVLSMPTPLPENDLRKIPADSHFAMSIGLDMVKLLDWAESFFPKRYGMEDDWKEVRAAFREETQLDLRSDLLDLLGPTIQVVERRSQKPSSDPDAEVEYQTDWSVSIGFHNYERMLATVQVLVGPELGDLKAQATPTGLLWSTPFLFSDIWTSLGSSRVAVSRSQETAQVVLQCDSALPPAKTFADASLWKLVETLPARCLLQASQGPARADWLPELVEVLLEFSGLHDTAVGEPLLLWTAMLHEHWNTDALDWTVLQVAVSAGRVEARVSTH
ncbi:MAG: hypothetical protein H6829_01565 [Planctomycetes bacterium]|nr:hypothetical protein [Planctomycetota bacterium]